jgi:hypothetical protein
MEILKAQCGVQESAWAAGLGLGAAKLSTVALWWPLRDPSAKGNETRISCRRFAALESRNESLEVSREQN